MHLEEKGLSSRKAYDVALSMLSKDQRFEIMIGATPHISHWHKRDQLLVEEKIPVEAEHAVASKFVTKKKKGRDPSVVLAILVLSAGRNNAPNVANQLVSYHEQSAASVTIRTQKLSVELHSGEYVF